MGSCDEMKLGDIDTVGPARIRWGTTDPATRAQLIRKMGQVHTKPTRTRALNYERARREADERAVARLTGSEVEPTEGQCWIVRIYYTSMGGETLACESERISRAAATVLERTPGALGTECYHADRPGWIPPLWRGARLVRLPSQHPTPVVTVEMVQPVLTAPTPPMVAPLRETGLVYRAAMARRIARTMAWRGHNVAA